MTRIVYAGPDYKPRAGEIVLPIEEHPAVIQDKMFGRSEPQVETKRGQNTPTADQIEAFMVKPMTTREIARGLGWTMQRVRACLTGNPKRFTVVGDAGTSPGHMSTPIWGVLGRHKLDNYIQRISNTNVIDTMRYIQQNGPTSTNDLVQAIGISRQSMHEMLNRNPNLFHVVGQARGSYMWGLK